MEYIDLTDDVIEIENEKNFWDHIANIQNILKLWKQRNLTIEGRENRCL